MVADVRGAADVSAESWPAGETFLAALDAAGRRGLLRVLPAPGEVRADLIGKLYAEAEEGGNLLAELLIELEEKDWARQWFVERLRDRQSS